MRRKKSEFRVKRNLLEKAFVYREGSAGIEHKINQFRGKKKLIDAKDAAIMGDLARGS